MDLPDRNVLEAFKALPNPADLFLHTWRMAAVWTPSDRDAAEPPSPDTKMAFAAALAHDDGPASVSLIIKIVLPHWPATFDSYDVRRRAAGLLLAMLASIDEVFRLIHPRTVRLAPGATPRVTVPEWLRRLEFHRGRYGWYAEDASSQLVARGPLKRVARSAAASFADSLPDRFSAIGVCRRSMVEGGRPIGIRMLPVGSDAATGVPSSGISGGETVGFVAVAEGADDLDVVVEERGGREYVDFRPRADLNEAARIFEAARGLGPVDLLVCPELTVSSDGARRLGGLLAGAGIRLANVVLAGSGLSADTHADERHWNEARLLNGAGVVLATQRKVWPFGLSRSKADGYGILESGSTATGLVMEDVASGTEISIIEMSGFGRVIILICQDFEAQPLVSDLISEYQPDWVLVPILDLPLRNFGWTNNRAFGLSGYAQARFIVVNSLTLSNRTRDATATATATAIGLALGPRDPTADASGAEVDKSRAFALAVPDITQSPSRASLTWRDGTAVWQEMVLTAKL
ncbi:hypothetical protein ACFZ8E_04005 [Methylobacterium sp. HMF5984]|uniref:hypothetical protein n=1 Tax=Methylobacterium sp. HMF5984 TaxID=3367370 RepID=UPI0038536E23